MFCLLDYAMNAIKIIYTRQIWKNMNLHILIEYDINVHFFLYNLHIEKLFREVTCAIIYLKLSFKYYEFVIYIPIHR